MLILFKVGTTDYTANILNDETYNVRKDDVFDVWEDANRVEHRNIVRTRVAGSFNLKFRDEASYTSFLTTLAAAKQAEGYYSCSIYCNNTKTVENVNLFISFEPVLVQESSMQLSFKEFALEVRER